MLRSDLFSERSLLTGIKNLNSTRKCSIHSLKSKNGRNCEEVSALCKIRGLHTHFMKLDCWRHIYNVTYLMITVGPFSHQQVFWGDLTVRIWVDTHVHANKTYFFIFACGDNVHMLSSSWWACMLWPQCRWYFLPMNSIHSQKKTEGGSHLLHTCH